MDTSIIWCLMTSSVLRWKEKESMVSIILCKESVPPPSFPRSDLSPLSNQCNGEKPWIISYLPFCWFSLQFYSLYLRSFLLIYINFSAPSRTEFLHHQGWGYPLPQGHHQGQGYLLVFHQYMVQKPDRNKYLVLVLFSLGLNLPSTTTTTHHPPPPTTRNFSTASRHSRRLRFGM